MKCVQCDRVAEYIYAGYSYCNEHKEKHDKRIQIVIKRVAEEEQ